MDKTTIIIIATALFLLCMYLVYKLLKRRFEQRLSAIETQLASNDFVANELKDQQQRQDEVFNHHKTELAQWQLEHQQVSQQLEHRIKVLQEKLASYQEQITQLQQQQPQDRLYTRAQKMVSLGADVEEIVNECGLPVAEAEILIRMHKKS